MYIYVYVYIQYVCSLSKCVYIQYVLYMSKTYTVYIYIFFLFSQTILHPVALQNGCHGERGTVQYVDLVRSNHKYSKYRKHSS